MRWHFYDRSNQIEMAEHEAVLRRIDAWWSEFADRKKDLEGIFSGKSEWDLPAWMHEHLQGIAPELMWEFGPALRVSGHRLVITPESKHSLRPLVNAIVERAPKIEGWEFYTHRVAEGLDWALVSVKGRTGFEMKDARVQLSTGDDQRIDLRYSFAAPGSGDDALHAAFVATESLLGEPVLDRWIGAIEVASPPRRSFLSFGRRAEPEGIPLAELAAKVRETIDGIITSLPQGRCLDRADDNWKMWKLDPPRGRDDFEGQLDLFVGKSMYPEMWRATRSGRPFFSEVYSRSGETFCYLKLDGSDGLDDEHFADKGEIEDAIDEALRRENVGCFVGGGTGLRYSYIDLALDDIERGAAIVGEILRGGNITRRSWLLFYDAELAGEWIGMWPDTPAPPE